MSASRLEQTYAHFRAFCASVGIEKPMAAQLWLAITDYVLKEPPVTKPPVSTVPNYCPPRNPEKDLREARAKADGLTVRTLGGISREGFFNFRTCRACGECLPLRSFSKHRSSLRSICKNCDNNRRVARRSAMAAD